MAFTLSSTVTGLTDPGLAAAVLAGETSTETPITGLLAMIFPWASGSYDQALAAPPSGYTSAVEGQEVTPEAFDQIGTASITSAERGLSYSLSMTAYRTVPRPLLLSAFAAVGAKAPRFFEAQLAELLDDAEGTTTTIDGVAWGSAAHTSAVGNMSNLVNAALTFSNYQTAVELLLNQEDHRGDIMGGSPTALLVATDNMVLARQILGATHAAADDRSQPNVLAGSARAVVAADLADGHWSLFSEPQFRAHGALAVPVVAGPILTEDAQEKGTFRYRVDGRISCGFGSPVDWRGSVIGDT